MDEIIEDEDEIEENEEDSMDDEEFTMSPVWINAFSSESCSDLKKCIEQLLSMLYDQKYYKTPCFAYVFLHIFYANGVAIKLKNCKNSLHDTLRIKKIPIIISKNRGNIAQLVRQLSEVFRGFSMNDFILNKLMPTAYISAFSYRFLQAERMDLWRLSLQNYQKGLEVRLRSTSLLRHFGENQFIREMQNMLIIDHFSMNPVTMGPQVTLLAVQTVLRNRKMSLTFVGEQLIQLAHSHVIQLSGRKSETEVLGNLNEIFLCALALNNLKAQSEIINFQSILKSKPFKFLCSWNSWINLSRIEKLMMPSYLDIDRMLENLDSDLIGPNGLVFVETACLWWKKLGNEEEKIINFILDFIKKYPNFGERMIKLIEKLEMEHEINVLIEEMCEETYENNVGLHKSDSLWLKWVERRIKNLKRFGAIKTTISMCIKRLFDFLDFGTNRFNGKAWTLLHETVQKASPEMVQEQWITRQSWWLKLHRVEIVGDLDEETQHLRKEVLEALQNFIVS